MLVWRTLPVTDRLRAFEALSDWEGLVRRQLLRKDASLFEDAHTQVFGRWLQPGRHCFDTGEFTEHVRTTGPPFLTQGVQWRGPTMYIPPHRQWSITTPTPILLLHMRQFAYLYGA